MSDSRNLLHSRASAYLARLVPPWVALIIVLSLLLQLAGSSEQLLYDRQAIAAGQLWRLISAHLLHFNALHLEENIAALLLINLLVGRYTSSCRWLAASLYCALVISLALYLLQPQLQWYMGLSGVLHGLLVVGIVSAAIAARGGPLYVAALAAITLKLVMEALLGGEQIAGVNVVIEAHRYGALGGLSYVLLIEWPLRSRDVAANRLQHPAKSA